MNYSHDFAIFFIRGTFFIYNCIIVKKRRKVFVRELWRDILLSHAKTATFQWSPCNFGTQWSFIDTREIIRYNAQYYTLFNNNLFSICKKWKFTPNVLLRLHSSISFTFLLHVQIWLSNASYSINRGFYSRFAIRFCKISRLRRVLLLDNRLWVRDVCKRRRYTRDVRAAAVETSHKSRRSWLVASIP